MNAVLAACGTPDLLHHYFWAFWSRYSLPADGRAFLAAGLNCAITVAITVWCFKAACGTAVTIKYAKLSLLILSNSNMCVSCRGIPHSWEKSLPYIFCLQQGNGIQWCHKGRWQGTIPVTCSSLWDLLMLSLFLSDRPSGFSSWCCPCARSAVKLNSPSEDGWLLDAVDVQRSSPCVLRHRTLWSSTPFLFVYPGE